MSCIAEIPGQPVIAVIDIGKTNVKVSAIRSGNFGGDVVAEHRQPNAVLDAAPYPQVNEAAVWRFLLDALTRLAAEYYVESIAITTHGATAACVTAAGELVLPIADYESHCFDETGADYARLKPPFSETGSPDLPVGLNLGRQLFWLSERFPDAFERTEAILMYPQYWGWKLTGIMASEVTSLGCHTDLWNPHAMDYSSLVSDRGWQDRFPPMVGAGEVLGPIHPDLLRITGLPDTCLVRNGIHDSNASLVTHILMREEPFTVVSSGTWTILCGVGAPLEGLDETRDMLVNINAFGTPVPTIRFMGGREWEYLRASDQTTWEDLEAVLRRGVMALPSFVDSGGPFHGRAGEYVGEVDSLTPDQKTALAALYCALMTDYCLQLLNNGGDVVVEGALGQNPLYLGVLAALIEPRGEKLWVSGDSAGTTQGTSMLGQNINHWPLKAPDSVAPAHPDGLADYAAHWRALAETVE